MNKCVESLITLEAAQKLRSDFPLSASPFQHTKTLLLCFGAFTFISNKAYLWKSVGNVVKVACKGDKAWTNQSPSLFSFSPSSHTYRFFTSFAPYTLPLPVRRKVNSRFFFYHSMQKFFLVEHGHDVDFEWCKRKQQNARKLQRRRMRKKKEEEEIQRLANFKYEWIIKHIKLENVACFDPVW